MMHQMKLSVVVVALGTFPRYDKKEQSCSRPRETKARHRVTPEVGLPAAWSPSHLTTANNLTSVCSGYTPKGSYGNTAF